MRIANEDIDGLLSAYFASGEYGRLAGSTRTEYQRVGAYISREVGALPVQELTRPTIRRLRDSWAGAGHRAATLRLQVLKNAVQPLIDDDLAPTNLFDRLNRVRGPGHRPEPHPVWTPCDLAAVSPHCIQRASDLYNDIARLI